MSLINEFLEVTSNYLGFTSEDIFNKKPLRKKIYKKLGDKSTIATLDGIKVLPYKLAVLPYKLAVIIMYYRDQALAKIHMDKMMQSITEEKEFDTENYEEEAIKIRDYYNQIIYFYHDDYKKKMKK